MSRLVEILYVLALIALATWAGTDGVINGKEVVLLIGIVAYVAWVVRQEEWS